jgi:hypothetical protein
MLHDPWGNIPPPVSPIKGRGGKDRGYEGEGET